MTAGIGAKPGGAGFSLRGTLVPLDQWRTEVRRGLKSARQELFHAVTVPESGKDAIEGRYAIWSSDV